MAHAFIAAVGTLAYFGMIWSAMRAFRTFPDEDAMIEEVRRTFAPCTAVCCTCIFLLLLMGPSHP